MIELAEGARVLYKDANGLVAIEKPSGVLSHPNVGFTIEQQRPLVRNAVRYSEDEEAYVFSDDKEMTERRLWLLHRLDSATSGIVLVSDVREVAEAVRRQFAERRVSKVYLAYCFGTPRQSTMTWINRLAVTSEGREHRYVKRSRKEGTALRTAVSTVRVLRVIPNRSSHSLSCCLLELCPKTGYTHQLRVQSAAHGLPIIGDRVYGDFARNRMMTRMQRAGHPPDRDGAGASADRLMLHAKVVQLEYSFNGERVPFRAESVRMTRDFLTSFA